MLKQTVLDMKTAFERVISRLKVAKKRINELNSKTIEKFQTKIQRNENKEEKT